jgi:hypothetical protein
METKELTTLVIAAWMHGHTPLQTLMVHFHHIYISFHTSWRSSAYYTVLKVWVKTLNCHVEIPALPLINCVTLAMISLLCAQHFHL